MRKILLATAALVALPVAAQAQMQPNPNPGFYIGGEGGLNWMFNTTANVPGFGGAVNIYPATGWAAGGMISYDFLAPRIEPVMGNSLGIFVGEKVRHGALRR
jgi:hypothetical protein